MSFASLLLELGLTPALAWFIFGFILLILELLNPSALIFFFGFGAWTVSAIIPWANLNTSWQLVVFLLSSLLYLALLRSTVLQYIERTMGDSGHSIEDDYIGKTALVTEDINPPLLGKVMFNGTHWGARSLVPLKVGQPVQIIDRDNLTLIVEAIG